ncbi:MAG: PhoU domain-containing protein [Promethearchaeota archaeon]
MSKTTRKINQVRNSFYVYLPRSWCDDYNLTKESEVMIERTFDGKLAISPVLIKSTPSKPLKLTLTKDSSKDIVNLLVGSYIVGTNELELKFTDSLDMETREEISSWVDKLEGWGILSEHDNSVFISDLLTSDREVIRKVLQRQFSTAKYMLERMIASLELGDMTGYSHVLSRDEQVDRNRYLVERLCHLVLRDPSYARKISLPLSDALSFSLAAKHVERVADHICGAIIEFVKNKAIDSRMKNLASEIADLYDKTISVFFSIEKKGKEDAEDFASYSSEHFDALRRATRLANSLRKLESSRKKKSSHEILLALHLGRIASYCGDIIEIGINRMILAKLQDEGAPNQFETIDRLDL